MRRQSIQDRNFHQIGELLFEDSGRIIASDRNGHQFGYYEPCEDATYRRDGSYFGAGDLTMGLIYEHQ